MADPYPLCSLENRVIPPKILPPPPSSPTQAKNNDRSLTGTNFALGSYQKFQPGFRDEKRPKILGTSVSVKNSSSFYPSNRDKVFIWQIFPARLPISPVAKTEISGTESVRPPIWTHRKGFLDKAKSRKTGQPGQPSSCEQALRDGPSKIVNKGEKNL